MESLPGVVQSRLQYPSRRRERLQWGPEIGAAHLLPVLAWVQKKFGDLDHRNILEMHLICTSQCETGGFTAQVVPSLPTPLWSR